MWSHNAVDKPGLRTTPETSILCWTCWNPWLEYINSFLNRSSSQVVLNNSRNTIIFSQLLELYLRYCQHTEKTELRGEYLALSLKIFMSLSNETNSFGALENTFHPPNRWWTKAGLDVPEAPTCLWLTVTMPLVQGDWQYCWNGDGEEAGKSPKNKSIRKKRQKYQCDTHQYT